MPLSRGFVFELDQADLFNRSRLNSPYSYTYERYRDEGVCRFRCTLSNVVLGADLHLDGDVRRCEDVQDGNLHPQVTLECGGTGCQVLRTLQRTKLPSVLPPSAPSLGTWNCLTTIAHANDFGVDEFTEEVANDGLQGAIDLLGSLFWQFDSSEEVPLCPLRFCVLPLL